MNKNKKGLVDSADDILYWPNVEWSVDKIRLSIDKTKNIVLIILNDVELLYEGFKENISENFLDNKIQEFKEFSKQLREYLIKRQEYTNLKVEEELKIKRVLEFFPQNLEILKKKFIICFMVLYSFINFRSPFIKKRVANMLKEESILLAIIARCHLEFDQIVNELWKHEKKEAENHKLNKIYELSKEIKSLFLNLTRTQWNLTKSANEQSILLIFDKKTK